MNRLFRWAASGGLLSALLLPGGARAALLSVVVDDLRPSTRKIIATLEKDLGAGHKIQVHTLQSLDITNPLVKGRFLSRVAAGDLIVPIGDRASRWVTDELEELKTFFIAAGGLSGKTLSRRQVAGILSYSPEETMRVAKALLPDAKNIGILYTPGYESVSLRMRAAADSLGLDSTAYMVASRREVGPSVRRAAARSDLVWTVGDPLLTQDLIFAYLLQESLRLKKPLAGPLPDMVEKGALFCTVPDADKLAALASEALASILAAQEQPPDEDRLLPPAGKSFVLINQRLAEKWRVRIPPSLRLWTGNAP